MGGTTSYHSPVPSAAGELAPTSLLGTQPLQAQLSQAGGALLAIQVQGVLCEGGSGRQGRPEAGQSGPLSLIQKVDTAAPALSARPGLP